MKCIIIDDEPLARETIESLIKENAPNMEIVGRFNQAQSAATYMDSNPVDLVFLDIQMPGITGLEFAKRIPQKTLVIFTTAYSEYAVDSYEVDAIDYLTKPIDDERFRKAVQKAESYHEFLSQKEDMESSSLEVNNQEYFLVKSDRKFFRIKFDDILFVEGLKDYVIIHLDSQKIVTRMNMKGINDILPTNHFIRVNKSFIVNTEKIESFDNNDIFIKTFVIPIGNIYRDDFFNKYVAKFQQ
ncbi:MAG: response regulator transcription factor [Paludibacteraceae bacterium]|nr:response regulator transcription factor [Paludibacteraceae bacterium]MBR4840874.1 response regulator transcription factor [Paludibacteraceae bacterium]